MEIYSSKYSPWNLQMVQLRDLHVHICRTGKVPENDPGGLAGIPSGDRKKRREKENPDYSSLIVQS